MKLLVINGFLGSGKTTVLKNILKQSTSSRIAVVINEFGDSSFDSNKLSEMGTFLEEIHHGSIFCSCKSDVFIAKLIDLMRLDFDFIIVESSGFANPSSLFDIIEFAKKKSGIAEISVCSLTVVDPITFPKLAETLIMLRKQVEVADILILNKMDINNGSNVADTWVKLHEINPNAEILTTTFGSIDSSVLPFVETTRNSANQSKIKSIIASSLTFRVTGSITRIEIEKFLMEIRPLAIRCKGTILVDGDPTAIEIASDQIIIENSDFVTNEIVILYSSVVSSQNELKDIIEQSFPNWEIKGYN